MPPAHPARTLLFLPGTVMPALVALWVTSRREGADGVRALLSGITRWDVGARWYLFAFGYLAAIKLLVALASRIVTGDWPTFGTTPFLVMLGATLLSTPTQAGEEIGWRGFALPRMAERIGLRWASVLLGVIWALWHLPLFFVAGSDTLGQSFPVYLITVTALAVTLAWLHAGTRGSLLLVMLMHAAVNNTKDIVPSAGPPAASSFTLAATPVAWGTATLLWVGAAWFLWRTPAAGPRGYSRGPGASPTAD